MNKMFTFKRCSAAIILKYAQHCSGDTMARISSSVGKRKSGLITHQFESIPVKYNTIQIKISCFLIIYNFDKFVK